MLVIDSKKKKKKKENNLKPCIKCGHKNTIGLLDLLVV